jgi:glycosyltransferase involved in cell wall biosynthesis
MICEAIVRAPVSVIIPCYRCASTIRRAVQSVIDQTQKPTEVILVDDESGDKTLAVLQELEKSYPSWIKVIALTKNQGVASARNAGWAIATQPFIAFLDSDDAWHPKKIEIQFAYMNQHPEVTLSGHMHQILSKDDHLPNWPIQPATKAVFISKWDLLLSNRFITPSIMLRSNISQRFSEEQRYMEDHLLWLEVLCDGAIVMRLTEKLAATYKSSFGFEGLSSNIQAMERAELYNYLHIYKTRRISLSSFIFLEIFSLIKYLRRLAIVNARKILVYLGIR